MRILFSTDQIYLHGGLEKVMAQKANYFSDVLGYEVHILTTEQNENIPCYPLSETIQLTDIAVNYHRKKSYFHLQNLLKVTNHFNKWRKAIKVINPDVIIVCNYAFDFYWTPFIFKNSSKFKEYHSSRFFINEQRARGGFISKIKFGINDFFESKYTKLIILNPDEKEFYKTNNLEVIANPIDTSSHLQATLTSKKAIAAGRIAPVKGFENAILAWREVVKEAPDWELHIFGQGEKEYIEKLNQLIVEQNLQKKVLIHSAVKNLQEKMLDYSMYVMSSHTECFPMVLLESLAVGLPIVSFDCPTGPRNIVTNNVDGFIVENQNSNALAEKVLFLIASLDKRIEMGKNAKKSSINFSNENIMKKWEHLFLNNKK